jgi:CheY-like chemotaxis protein
MNAATANILVVDDDVKTLTAMEALLAGPGRNISTASSGTEALRLLLREDFALILMDVRLPVMDGFETAALIRQRERFRYTQLFLSLPSIPWNRMFSEEPPAGPLITFSNRLCRKFFRPKFRSSSTCFIKTSS